MHDHISERTLEEAKYIIDSKSTLRDTARIFGVSKSTVFKDVTERLPKINHKVASEVREVLDINKDARALRGGLALAAVFQRRGHR